MFSTCIHCARDLGKNEAFETFPVGKRLAFDAARGRLWVVCPSCARWNLSPLDARWETIENAEQRFRSTKLRVSTDNIGMARLREGVELEDDVFCGPSMVFTNVMNPRSHVPRKNEYRKTLSLHLLGGKGLGSGRDKLAVGRIDQTKHFSFRP